MNKQTKETPVDTQIRAEIEILETHRNSPKLNFSFIAIHAANLAQLATFAMEKVKSRVRLPKRNRLKPDPLFTDPLPTPTNPD